MCIMMLEISKVRTTKVKAVQSQHKQTQPVKKRPPSNPQSEREGTINMHSHGHTLESLLLLFWIGKLN